MTEPIYSDTEPISRDMDDNTRSEVEDYLGFLSKRPKLPDVTEEYLLNILAGSRRKYDVYGAILLLRHFGTDKSIEALKQCCLRPTRDHQITAVYTLAKIAGPRLADFFEQLIGEKQFREKWAAMAALCEFGEARHLPTVLSRVQKVVRRKRACPEYGTMRGKETEVIAALKFLDRNHLDDDATTKAVRKIAQSGVELTESERGELQRFLTSRGFKVIDYGTT